MGIQLTSTELVAIAPQLAMLEVMPGCDHGSYSKIAACARRPRSPQQTVNQKIFFSLLFPNLMDNARISLEKVQGMQRSTI